MNLSFARNISSEISDERRQRLEDAAFIEFKKISCNITRNNEGFSCTGINATFGSILRDDTTLVSVRENMDGKGYIVNCETKYAPSVAFWVFTVIDFVLLTTVIGFFVGMGITLALYFYNKSAVENGIRNALDKVVTLGSTRD